MTWEMNKQVMIIVAAALTLGSCHSSKQEVAVTPKANTEATARALPRARIYKTNGNYRANVPITLTANGKGLVSYPAPTDIRPSMMPIELDGGYLLDTRGIGPNTAFTTYTYEQYSQLPAPPTPKQLMDAIIPDAKITMIREVPSMSIGEAINNVAELNKLINSSVSKLPQITL